MPLKTVVQDVVAHDRGLTIGSIVIVTFIRLVYLHGIVSLLSYAPLSKFIRLRPTFITLGCFVALEVVQQIYEAKDDWASLFRPSDFFQKYK